MSVYSADVGPVGTGGSYTITQSPPLSGTVSTWGTASYNLTLESTGQHSGAAVAWTQISGSAHLLVDIYGHLTTVSALQVGAYTATGTMADAYGGVGVWSFTLAVGGGYILPTAGGISIAFADRAFTANPTWVRIDTAGVATTTGVTQWTVDRGRTSMLDTTQAGTAAINILDATGKYDPTNSASPLYGDQEPPTPYSSEIGPMRAVNIQLLNPVNGQYYNIFTGYTESWTYSFPDPQNERFMQVVVNCSDGFEPLSRAELVPNAENITPFAPVVGLNAMKLRMLAVLSQFQLYTGGLDFWPTDPDAIFSGNISILSAAYAPQTSLLSALQDAADAEFPGVANLFMDKFGNVAARGRVARFLPQNYNRAGGQADINLPPTLQQPIQYWTVGDANAANTNVGGSLPGPTVPIFDIGWIMDNASVINVCQCYPGGSYAALGNILATNTSTGQRYVDNNLTQTQSITQFGARVLSIPNLYTGGSAQFTTGGGGNPYLEPIICNPDGSFNRPLTPLEETKLFADAYANNFSWPTPRINKLTFQTVAPATTQGNAWWHFVTGVEIGDLLNVYTTNPSTYTEGGMVQHGGFSTSGDPDGFNLDQFFVEGIHYQVTVGGPYPQITMTLDVSPREWFTYFNGFYFYGPYYWFGPVIGNGSDGQVTNGIASFANSAGGFTSADLNKTIIILDQVTNTPYAYKVVGLAAPVMGVIYEVFLSAPYAGHTVTTAPYEVVEML